MFLGFHFCFIVSAKVRKKSQIEKKNVFLFLFLSVIC